MIFGSEIVVINFDQELQQINHKNSQEIKNEASMILNSQSTVVISVFKHHHRVVPEILTKFRAEIAE